jgi:hypothetical protein
MNNKYNKIELKSESISLGWLLSNGVLVIVAKISALQMSLKF